VQIIRRAFWRKLTAMDKRPLSPSDLLGLSARAALSTATQYLALDDPSGAAIDARRLLLHALAIDTLDYVKHPDRPLTESDAQRLAHMLARRSAGEPVSRISGWRGFYGREFQITPATLDPRPETETLVDAALVLVATDEPAGRNLEIIDIGTGSGCLLITLLAELPFARGVGIDISRAALAVAAANATRIGVGDRCTWVEGRNFASCEWTRESKSQLVVSNPPYIPTIEIASLSRDVQHYDPATALDGGADGLDVYREIASELAVHVASGWVLFEAGDGQASDIQAIVRKSVPPARLSSIKIYLDMAGKQRCVAFQIQN
jgi:release factor glutamine methyltransferase